MLLKNCRYLVTQNEFRDILENVDVLVEGNRIKQIGKDLNSKDDSIDCSNRIVLPGLINAHMHLGMTSLRGFSDDKELKNWLREIVSEESRMKESDFFESATIGIRESLRTGTTTAVEMYSPITPVIRSAQKEGIRILAYISFFTAHGNVPENIVDVIPKLLDLPDRIEMGLGPHSIYGCDDDFLNKIREFASNSEFPITIHVSETRKERADAKRQLGVLPVEHLNNLGFLGPDVLMAHCVWLTKGELDLLAKHDVKVVHCPQSNMKLAGGSVMPLKEMHERGITVALGTDSTASNNSLDMFREMHVCALLHKHHYWDSTSASAQKVLDMATVDGSKAVGKPDLGSIEEGKLADIITLDLSDENLRPHTKDRIVSHLVYSANGLNVSEVIVDGVVLLKDKLWVKG